MGFNYNVYRDPYILPIGPEGSAGQSGPQGPQGEVGPTGSTGAAGSVGSQGDQGENGAGYGATSTTSIDVLSTGSTTVNAVIETGKAFVPGARVRFSDTSSPTTNYFEGIVTAYNSSTGDITVSSIDFKRGTGTYADWQVNIAGENAFNVYDSGWKVMNSHNGTFGFAPVTGWTNPSIRIVGRTVFITGEILIPLAQTGASTTLRTISSEYRNPYNVDTQTYTGADGGYSVNVNGSITSQSAIIPSVLMPTQSITFGKNLFAQRNILDTGNTHVIILNTLFGKAILQTNGKLVIVTQLDSDDSVGTPTTNFSPYQFITKADSGANVPSYSTYKQQIGGFAVTDSGKTYPADVDGANPAKLGGYNFLMNVSYPISSSYTESEIKTAFDSI